MFLRCFEFRPRIYYVCRSTRRVRIIYYTATAASRGNVTSPYRKLLLLLLLFVTIEILLCGNQCLSFNRMSTYDYCCSGKKCLFIPASVLFGGYYENIKTFVPFHYDYLWRARVFLERPMVGDMFDDNWNTQKKKKYIRQMF